MFSRIRRSVLATLLVSVPTFVATPAAHAALGFTDVTVTPSTTQAAAHSTYGLGFRLSDPAQQIKDLTIHLPPGLVGNPLAQPVCALADFSADTCPAASKVGTSQVNADPMNLTIDGTIYNLVPQPGEPARLGIVYRNPTISSMFVQSAVSLRAADGGLDSIIKDLPRQAMIGGLIPTAVTVKGISLSLQSSFISNPTGCAPATTRLDATSYATPTTVASGEASFTTTGCDKVPFAPKLSVEITGTAKGTSPAVSTAITQADGEASVRGAVVTLPDGVGPNLAGLGATCQPADATAGSCPDATAVGTATVQTPLLRDPLQGKVFLVAGKPNELPTLAIDLRGALRILLSAKVGLSKRGLVETKLDNIPDVPLSRFALSFKGSGKTGVLSNVEDLCGKLRPFTATFTSQGGTKAVSAGATRLKGCAPSSPGAKKPATVRRPRVTASLSKQGTLTLVVRAGSRRVRGVRVALARKGHLGRRTTRPGRIRFRGRVLTVDRLPKAGSSRVVVHIRGARRVARPRLTVTVTDAAARRTVLRVQVR